MNTLTDKTKREIKKAQAKSRTGNYYTQSTRKSNAGVEYSVNKPQRGIRLIAPNFYILGLLEYLIRTPKKGN